jgi:uncharacterized membrane protein YgdD (TMEM256/DUF423 family)
MNKAADRSANLWLAAGSANGLMAVAMGAFAAHGLKDTLPSEALGWVRTASEYQMWHGLALLALAILRRDRGSRAVAIASWAFLLGIILFSGSLYFLALSGWRGFAWITPIGGVALLLGWAFLVWHGLSGGTAR